MEITAKMKGPRQSAHKSGSKGRNQPREPSHLPWKILRVEPDDDDEFTRCLLCPPQVEQLALQALSLEDQSVPVSEAAAAAAAGGCGWLCSTKAQNLFRG